MEQLIYKRKATKTRDGHNGYLYLHVWPTGYQFLIFDSRDIEKTFPRVI